MNNLESFSKRINTQISKASLQSMHSIPSNGSLSKRKINNMHLNSPMRGGKD